MTTKRLSPKDAEAIIGDHFTDDPELVSVIVCHDDAGKLIGYYDQRRDGLFYCIVFNDDICTADEDEAQAFLVEHMEKDCVTDDERSNGPRR